MRILVILLFLSLTGFSQNHPDFLNEFLLEQELNPENQRPQYNRYDFSSILTTTKNHLIVGIIGAEYERIRIKFLEVLKTDSDTYTVKGKSLRNNLVRDFSGTIKLSQINTFKKHHLGVDNLYADSNILAQGVLIAKYRFEESKKQPEGGMFEGTLYTKWYLDSSNRIQYDQIQSVADSYMNNAFIGTWTSYKTRLTLSCNWGDFRVPLANQDFDVGAGEFSPSDKYIDKGWEIYQKAWLYGDLEARKSELSEWWK